MSTSPTTTVDETSAGAPHSRLSTPGEILQEEFLEPLGISRYRLAKAMGVEQTAVGEIVNGRRAISVAMAYRLAGALGTTPQFWLGLQRDYDLMTFDTSQLGPIVPLTAGRPLTQA